MESNVLKKLLVGIALSMSFCCVSVPTATVVGQETSLQAPASGSGAKGELFIGGVDEHSAQEFIEELGARVAAGEKQIVIKITSPGGDVFAGMAMGDAMEQAADSGVQLVCVADRFAASMGFVLLQNRGCAVRVMTKRTVLLAHGPSAQAAGTSQAIASQAAFLAALEKAMAEEAAARLLISVEEYLAKTDNKDWSFTWQEALDVGAVDEVVEF